MAEGELFPNHSTGHLLWRRIGLLEQRESKRNKAEGFVCVSECYTLTLVDQVESSGGGLAFGGEADQDLVGGC